MRRLNQLCKTICIGLMTMTLFLFIDLVACHRKPKMDPINDVPDLPGDTVYVTRLVDRCDYKYLSLDPKVSQKQMAGMIKALDNFILHNDSIIKNRMSIIRAQQAVIRTFPEKDANQGS